MTLPRNGRIARLLLVVLVAAVVALPGAGARAALHPYEVIGSVECSGLPPEGFADSSDSIASATGGLILSSGSIDLFARAGVGSYTVSASTAPYWFDLRTAAELASGPTSESSTCTASSAAASNLVWDLRSNPPTSAPVLLELRAYWGSVNASTMTFVGYTDDGLGLAQSPTMTFGVSVVDSDGTAIMPLGEVLCDIDGCSSAAFAVSDASVDSSQPGYRERHWLPSTATIRFELTSGSTWSIRFLATASLLASSPFFESSTTYAARFLDGLSYELVSLDPSVTPVLVPEPAMLALLAAGVGAVVYLYRRRG